MWRYRLGQIIYDGTFAVVYKATLLSDENSNGTDNEKKDKENKFVAIKRPKHRFRDPKDLLALREIKSLIKVNNHPNVVKLREIIQENDDFYLVFDYYDSNVYKIIRKFASKQARIPEGVIKSIIKQVLSGLSYIHSKGIIHRDIKPENVLCNKRMLSNTTTDGIDQEGTKDEIASDACCCIADFACSRSKTASALTEYVGTRWYRAPELLLHIAKYGPPIDIWATGVLMTELYMLFPIFQGSSEIDQIKKIIAILGFPHNIQLDEAIFNILDIEGFSSNNGARGISPLNIHNSYSQDGSSEKGLGLTSSIVTNASITALDLIKKMLKWNPLERLTAAQALDHPFFFDF